MPVCVRAMDSSRESYRETLLQTLSGSILSVSLWGPVHTGLSPVRDPMQPRAVAGSKVLWAVKELFSHQGPTIALA